MADKNPGIANLISWWTLNEGAGLLRVDSHGSNDLTDVNNVGSVAGKVGNAADFEDSLSQELTHVDNASLSFGDEDFMIGGWIQLESKPGANAFAIAKWGAGTLEYALFFDPGADRFRFAVSDDGATSTIVNADSLGSPALTTWYFVLAWNDSVNNTINIQINNGTIDSIAHSGGSNDNTSTFRLGDTDFGGNFWDGLEDEVFLASRIFDADLSLATHLINSQTRGRPAM